MEGISGSLSSALAILGVAAMRTVTLDGKTYRWRDINRAYKEQRAEERKSKSQPTLFELVDDARPKSQKTATGRFQEPTLFD